MYNKNEYPFQEETFEIIGTCMEVHRILGRGLLEIVYKDAIEYELNLKGFKYAREKQYQITYKGIILPHMFFADFVIEDKIILEVKCKSGIVEEHYAQVLNYLSISKLKLGLICNFHEKSLQYKRIIF